MRELEESGAGEDGFPEPTDQLGLMFICCHPALDARRGWH